MRGRQTQRARSAAGVDSVHRRDGPGSAVPAHVLDSFPPVMFDLGRFNWAPTMELTAHVRALPAPGWIGARLSTRNIAGGMFEEDCELWDSDGRLVAQSRQLARQPRG
nr:acyl-CoA thioesterase domain-containing protein [Brevibacterium limosum]